jgi:hypothetical protein
MVWNRLVQGSLVCERCNEPLCFVKFGEFRGLVDELVASEEGLNPMDVVTLVVRIVGDFSLPPWHCM